MLTLNRRCVMKTATLTALSFLFLLQTAAAQGVAPLPSGMGAKTASAPAPVGTSGSTAADYRIATGDKLRIEVYKDAQLSQSLQVRPDGKITLPLVGDVTASGRTSMELRDAISTSLKDYITNPVVTVIVTETMPQVVYVTGEVNKPGSFALANGQMSVLQALAMAGGFTDFANRKDITILRRGPSGMQKLKFNYKEALDEDSKREPLPLLAGDTVVVK
jgi:polysaccharide biosynthesis/export protein